MHLPGAVVLQETAVAILEKLFDGTVRERPIFEAEVMLLLDTVDFASVVLFLNLVLVTLIIHALRLIIILFGSFLII